MDANFESKNENLQEIPQINQENGLSYDYINEVAIFVGLGASQSELIRQFVKEHGNRVRRYEECFPENEYINVVNEGNRESVIRLNMLVDGINADLQAIDTADIAHLLAKCQEVIDIVSGSKQISEGNSD